MRNQFEQSLADVLKQLTNQPKLKKPLYLSKVQSSWETLMGKSIAVYTKEIRIQRNTLYLTIESASLRNELSLNKEKIINLINEELGEPYIHAVVVS